jgi:hypothetical protein
MNTPYNTGKVKIGSNYQPPKYVEQDSDMLRLQSYLIYDPARLKRQYLINKFFIWLGVFVLVVAVLQS